ncbi:hypothetical protein O181_024937 [Austropuccinia psidii MF-1]|uniref:BHLH domain-containing protein n=1 Tax=Austropuccinia psidii MF-1 TaxID=1389203 RepID=A0A9Q3CMH8_9BASI|nr:hypothetical protein [Austropuccinia psidii MF-1]
MTAPTTTQFLPSQQLVTMAGFSNFSNLVPNHSPPTACHSENSSGSTSPPCFQPAASQAPLTDISHSAILADDDELGEDDGFDGCGAIKLEHKNQINFQYPPGRIEPKLSATQAAKLKITTAERRATHNAIERARRESLNGRFLELARVLPTMHNVKRPSKSVIVNKSLEWICESKVREMQLIRENAFLRNHVNHLRAQLQLEALPETQTLWQPHHAYKNPPIPALRSGLVTKQDVSIGSFAVPPQQSGVPPNILNQRGPALSSTAGPFAQSPVVRSFLPTQYEPMSSDSLVEHIQGPNKHLGLPCLPDSNQSDIGLVTLPPVGVSIHSDIGSPFQSLSDPEAPTSSVGSSPPSQIRYISSSGSSEGGGSSPTRLHNNFYPVEMDVKSNRHRADQSNFDVLPTDVLSTNAPAANTTKAASLVEATMGSDSKEFQTHASSMQSPHVHQPPSFSPPPAFVSATGAHEGFLQPSEPIPAAPRNSVPGGSDVNPTVMKFIQQQQANHGQINQISNCFPLGSSWVW